MQVYRKLSFWDRLIHEGQHTVFRVLSLIFSAASAWAIYWFFSALGNDAVQNAVTIFTSAGFVALGYFVTRGLAHRMMTKQRVRSYVPLLVLYIVVEVSCNFAHAVAKYPEVGWLRQLTGWQLGLFSIVLPLVLSIIPFFNWFLAVIDVDLMQEARGSSAAQTKQASPRFAGSGMATQTAYPTMPLPTSRPQSAQKQSGPNALGNWFQQKRSQAPAAAASTPANNGGGSWMGGYTGVGNGVGNGIP